jgi:hypothetical protein
MSAHRHEGCFVWVKVSLESKQTVGKCTCGSNTRSFCKEGVEPKRKEYRSAEAGECATEWIVWLKLFPLRVLGHPQEEFQVANRHRQSDAKGESRGDRERRKERMPAKAHVHLNDLQRGAQYNPDRIREIPCMPSPTVPSIWTPGVPPTCAARGEVLDIRSPNDRRFPGGVGSFQGISVTTYRGRA